MKREDLHNLFVDCRQKKTVLYGGTLTEISPFDWYEVGREARPAD